MITVLDVFREIGAEPDNEVMWSVGKALQTRWEAENGELPEKRLRPKKSGAGSHCMAVYPHSWKPRIIEEIKRHQYEETAQMALFA